MVVNNKMYTAESYCKEFLGLDHKNSGKENDLRDILDNEGQEDLWDYPLDEIDVIFINEADVVLVDTSYVNDNMELVEEYRWFEVPVKEEQ